MEYTKNTNPHYYEEAYGMVGMNMICPMNLQAF